MVRESKTSDIDQTANYENVLMVLIIVPREKKLLIEVFSDNIASITLLKPPICLIHVSFYVFLRLFLRSD